MRKYKYLLQESSWSRIIHPVESGTSFAVISAYMIELPIGKNKERHEELRKDIRIKGYGYIEQNSGYSYKKKDTDQTLMSDEESFFIPMMTKKDALQLCNKYEQESILFKDDSGFFCLLADGKIDMIFKTERNKKTGVITFHPDILKLAYSQLKKGTKNQRNQRFAYVVKECLYIEELKIPDRYQGLKEGKIPIAEFIRIL